MDMQIRFNRVEKAGFATAEDKDHNMLVRLTFTCPVDVSAVARLTAILRERCPLYIIVGSDQARLDLHVEGVDLRTGALLDK